MKELIYSILEASRDFVELESVTVGPFGPYTMRRCVAIEIIDDGDCEQSERFFLSLDSTHSSMTFPNNHAKVVIDGTTEYDDCGE